jgi:hypothetical protein
MKIGNARFSPLTGGRSISAILCTGLNRVNFLRRPEETVAVVDLPQGELDGGIGIFRFTRPAGIKPGFG